MAAKASRKGLGGQAESTAAKEDLR